MRTCLENLSVDDFDIWHFQPLPGSSGNEQQVRQPGAAMELNLRRSCEATRPSTGGNGAWGAKQVSMHRACCSSRSRVPPTGEPGTAPMALGDLHAHQRGPARARC